MRKPRFLGFTADGRRRWACDYEALPPIMGGAGGDPVMDDQVDASADDAQERESDGAMYTASDSIWVRSGADASDRNWGGLRFHNGPFPAQGSTVDVAYFKIYAPLASYDDANVDIHAQKAASPVSFSTSSYDVTSRPRTTASVAWVADSLGTGWKQSPSIVNVVQELVDSYSVTAIVIILKPRSDVIKSLIVRTWDYDPSLAAQLHLEWTEGGVQTLTPSPTAIPSSVPSPTVSLGAISLTPSPATVPFYVPGATLVLPSPTALTPSPAAIPLAVPTANISTARMVMPSPVPVTLTVVSPSVGPGPVSLTPTPVAAPWAIPTHVLVAPGAEGFAQFGNIIRVVDSSDFPSNTQFLFEATIKTRDPAQPCKVRLYNITDGVIVSGSELSTTNTSPTRLRSGALTLSGNKSYRVEFGGDSGGEYTCYAADVIVKFG